MSENAGEPNVEVQDHSDQGQQQPTEQDIKNNEQQKEAESNPQPSEVSNTNELETSEKQEKATFITEAANDTTAPTENRGNQSENKAPEQIEESKGEEIQGEVLRPNDLDDDDIERDDEDEEYDEGEYGDMDKLEIPKVEKDKGRDCFSKGNYEEATKHFAKAILAVNFLFKDQRVPTEEKAVELLKDIQALTLDEDNVKALYRKALAAFNLGELEISSDCLKRALELEPNNSEIRTLIQELRQRKKQLQEKEKKIGQQMLQELSKAREEEQESKKPKRKTETTETKPLAKITALKDKVMEPLITKKQEVTKKVKTWRDQLKLLILLPLSILSELCCKRRLPAQFYKLDQDKKNE